MVLLDVLVKVTFPFSAATHVKSGFILESALTVIFFDLEILLPVDVVTV
jgi:hypothetical protein